jgi:alkylhydroperoxidase family enzyme
MTWVKTVSMEEDERVAKAMMAQRKLYPVEYATPVHPVAGGESSSIVASHSLIPDALLHAFSTFGALMSPDLPLDRRKHEMITTVVSVTNRCHY